MTTQPTPHTYEGVGVSAGRIVGPVLTMAPPATEPARNAPLPETSDRAAEGERIAAAAEAVRARLVERAETASGHSREILEATAEMAADPSLTETAQGLVTDDGVHPERAVWDAAGQVTEMLAALGGYMAERVADVQDVRDRIIAELRGEPAPGVPESDRPFVLVAHDLAPADTAVLDVEKVLALVTSGGGPQSHTAILARQLGLPAVVAAKGADAIAPGTEVFVDGSAGMIETEVTEDHRKLSATWAELAANPLTFDGRGVLADGTHIQLSANVGSAANAQAAAAENAEGVGLFRTEFLFLDRDEEPGVDEQTTAYKAVLDAFPGQKVVIRTLDAGADKPLPFLTESDEPNPALGVRAYRTSWDKPEILENQLEAIAAAVAQSDADAWVMAPMIATVEDTERFVEMARAKGIGTVGIMIEVPSAAVMSETLMAAVDFASIGTNDLTQYVMASDRMLGSLAHLNSPWQPAVLQLVKATADGARRAGGDEGAYGSDGIAKPVGVCGESAGDPAMAVVLVGLGINSLSMTARSLPSVAEVLRTVTLDEAKEIAQLALAAPTADAARAAVRERLPRLDELGL